MATYKQLDGIPQDQLEKAETAGTMHFLNEFQVNGKPVKVLPRQQLQQISVRYSQRVEDTGEEKLERVLITFKETKATANVAIMDVRHLLTKGKDGKWRLSAERLSYEPMAPQGQEKLTTNEVEVHEESEVAEEDEFDGMDREALKRHIAANGLKDTVKVNKGMTDEDIRTAIRGALELA